MTSTDFGHECVTFEQKTMKVDEVFDKVSPYYDLMNDLMSLGLHRLWKSHFIQVISPQPREKICDLACGSGDISIELLKQTTDLSLNLVDPCPSMLKHARVKLAQLGVFRPQSRSKVVFNQLWAEKLSTFEDNSFDKLVCSFGFRNMTYKEKALQEIFRVLKPGGRFYMLEFSKVSSSLKFPYHFYRDKVLPQIGYIVGDTASYKYLAESIDVFWDQEQVVTKLQEYGFNHVTHQNFSQGICCYFSCQK